MSENYFYSSLSGQEIEDTLVGAVRFNAGQQLTTSQKLQARQNIGAGEADTQIKIKGFYATLADLQQAIPVGNEGDVYAVGTESPYDLYIWDAVNNVWVNNGPISFSDAIIDDNDVSTTSVWSSAKTTNEIASVISDSTVAANKAWSSSKLSGLFSRQNLLDNSNFAVNQRGQASYSVNNGMTVDRWVLRASSGSAASVIVLSNGIRLTGDGSITQGLNQPLVDWHKLLGKTVTLSALIANYSGTGELRLGLWFAANRTNHTTVVDYVVVDSAGLFSVTMTIPSTIPEISGNPAEYLNVGFAIMNSGSVSADIVAVKMELGATSTLAHMESAVPVLNEIPNYQQELAKCQAYYIGIKSYLRFRATYCSAGNIDFVISVPVAMHSNPSIVDTSSLEVRSWNAPSTAISGFSFAVQQFSANAIQIRASKATHGLTDAMFYGSSDWALSCEP